MTGMLSKSWAATGPDDPADLLTVAKGPILQFQDLESGPKGCDCYKQGKFFLSWEQDENLTIYALTKQWFFLCEHVTQYLWNLDGG